MAGLRGERVWDHVLQAVPSVLAPATAVLLWVGAWAWGSLGTLPLGAGSWE